MTRLRANQPLRIAVVGAGLSGTSFLSGLIRSLYRDRRNDLEVHVFEKNHEFGPGIYRTNLPETCFLNHENNSMGWVAPEDPEAGPDHYFQYLQANAERLANEHESLDISVLKDPHGYTPRFLYGQYLKEQFAQIEQLAVAAEIPFFKHRVEVERIQILGEQGIISWTNQGQRQTLDRLSKILLTIGHCWDEPLLKTLPDTNNFFQVYPIESLMNREVIAGQRVAVIGTGLSGVDAVFTAINSGARQVILTSRSARMRAVRGPVAKYYRKFFTREAVKEIVEKQGQITLSQVKKLFWQEYTAAFEAHCRYQENPEQLKNDPWSTYIGENYYIPDHHPNFHDFIFPEDTVARLQDDVKETENCPHGKGLLWRSIAKSMYDVEDGLEFFDYVYQRLPVEEQVTFMETMHRLHLNFTAAMPLPSAKRLLALQEEGKLLVKKGLANVISDPNSGALRLEMEDNTTTEADIGVDATGYAKDMTHHPLYYHLIEQGDAIAHPAGGISIDPETHALLTKNGSGLSPVLMAIGPATIGSAYVLKPDSIGNSTTALCLAEQVYRFLCSSQSEDILIYQ
ncbi:MAG: hypothetical protein GVY17_00640 [Cyanobacteria bacterium]|jgi:hypothetical protein|nr:hypothetical protein [Cyanobacteria bacterium GSL.Bin21]